jgi:hypothetical protein
MARSLDIVDAPLLDIAFVLGRQRPTGRDEEAVVLGKLPIAALHIGIVERGVDDRGAEIVKLLCPPSLCGHPVLALTAAP